MNTSLDDGRGTNGTEKSKKIAARRTSDERKKLKSVKLKKLSKDAYNQFSSGMRAEYMVDDAELVSDNKLEPRGLYIKRLLHTLSHQAINEEEEIFKKKPGKKIKREIMTDMDYKIMSIYKAPLPSSKPIKKKKNSFNLYLLND